MDLDSIVKRLKRLSEKQRRSRFETCDQILRGLGMKEYAVAPESPQFRGEQMLSLDPIPLVINPQEWTFIQQGLQQRMIAFEAFFQDIYNQRKILKEGLIPLDLILDNQEFYRECVRLFSDNQSFIRWAACDLSKNAQGQWIVVRDHFSIPPMLSYALQNRRTQNQIFPELFEDRLVQSIDSFPLDLLENLKSLLPRANKAQIVVLSNATHQSSEFDHSYLARKMGLPLVQPRDLTVRKGSLYYRTIKGLQPLHLALRCISSNHLDPLTFNGLDGTPGLIDCMRIGNIQIVNAPGTGMIGQRPLLKYADTIIRYYSHENPLISSLPTSLFNDVDEVDEILKKKSDYYFAHSHNIPLTDDQIQETLKANPSELVAHPRVDWQQLPHFHHETGEIHLRPFTLRCFASLSNHSFQLMPGGLTQTWDRNDFYNQSQFIAKDTWIIGGESRRTSPTPSPTSTFSPQWLGSRLAESLFWIGRYLERAEATARFLLILDEVHRESTNRYQRALPLWKALSFMTGHLEDFLPRLYKKDHAKVSWYMTLDPLNTASILHSLQQAKTNASELLDYIPPEAWTILNQLTQRLTALSLESSDEKETSLFLIRESLDLILNQTSAFNGMLFRTMTHDHGRDFLNLGMYLERSHLTLSALQSLYANPHLFDFKLKPEETDLENEVLTLLLRGFCTLDNYHRQFQWRALPLPVAEFLLTTDHVPISLQFCLKRIKALLSKMPSPLPFQANLQELIQQCHQIDLPRLFTPSDLSESIVPTTFLHELRALQCKLSQLTEKSQDHFFSHQAETPLLFINETISSSHEFPKK